MSRLLTGAYGVWQGRRAVAVMPATLDAPCEKLHGATDERRRDRQRADDLRCTVGFANAAALINQLTGLVNER